MNVTPHMKKAHRISQSKLPYAQAAEKMGVKIKAYARLLDRCRKAGLYVPDFRTVAKRFPDKVVISKTSRMDTLYPPGKKFERCDCGLMLPCFCKENDAEFRSPKSSRFVNAVPQDYVSWNDLAELDRGIKKFRDKNGLTKKVMGKGIGNAIY